MKLTTRDDGTRYKTIRFYKDATVRRRTLQTGLTLAQAQAHCREPETSSETCKRSAGRRRTKMVGAWFDGYERM